MSCLSRSAKFSLAVASVFLFSCHEASNNPVAVATAAGGSDGAKAVPATADAAVQPVTAKTAYWEMYKMARGWATDLTPLSLAAKKVTGHSIDGGKYVTWTAAFASPSKKEVRRFTYSVIAVDGIAKGPEADRPMAWAGPTRDATPFRIGEIAIDSDVAFQKAAKKADAWLKAHPKESQDVTITLGNAARFSTPVWYIMWGNQKSGFNAWINALNGDLLDK